MGVVMRGKSGSLVAKFGGGGMSNICCFNIFIVISFFKKLAGQMKL
jgi:hypothetical protein